MTNAAQKEIVDDMALPSGKSCADCRSFRRCQAFIGADVINAQAHHCDWAPSRFVPVPSQRGEGT